MSTKKKLDAWLPSTPCTQKMRESLIAVAEQQGRSLADVQREAISLFLRSFDSLTIEVDGSTIVKEWVREGQS